MPRPWEWDAELPASPNVEQLKKQAKELVKAVAGEDAMAVAFVREHGGDPSALELSGAQFVLARYLGAPSWPALMRRLTGDGPRPSEAPLLPVRAIVVFPGARVTLYIGRPPSLEAVENAIGADGYIVCATQREAKTEAPEREDIHDVGTLCRIVAVKRLPEQGTIKLRVDGVARVELLEVSGRTATIRPRPLPAGDGDADAVWKAAADAFEAYAERNEGISHRAVVEVRRADSARSALGLLLQNVHPLTVPLQQQLLEAEDPVQGLAAAARAFAPGPFSSS